MHATTLSVSQKSTRDQVAVQHANLTHNKTSMHLVKLLNTQTSDWIQSAVKQHTAIGVVCNLISGTHYVVKINRLIND